MKSRFTASWLPTSAVLSLTVALGCREPRTEVLLVVGSDLAVPADLDHLSIQAGGSETDGGFQQTYDLTRAPSQLPLSLGLLSPGGHSGPLHVLLTGLKGSSPIVARSANTMFVEGQVRVLHLDLQASCAGKTCPTTGETCVAGSCMSDTVSVGSLPRYPENDSGTDAPTARDANGVADRDSAGDAGDGPDAPADRASDATPELKSKGAACTSSFECAAAHCVDNVCCETPCTGACVSCGLSSAPGTCSPVPVGGQDPHGTCKDDGAASCGTNGRCDGASGCQHYPTATVCAPARCDGDTFVPAYMCAAGHCALQPSTMCGAGACHAGGCTQLAGLTFADVASSPIRGYSGAEATIFEDACPNGSVVIGYNVTTNHQAVNDVVDQLQTICGVPTLSAADRAAVLVSAGASLVVRGTEPGGTAALVCPPNQIVIGFDGRAVDLLDQISLRCAPLTVSGTSVTVGTPTNLTPAGGTGGNPFPRTDCGAGKVAVGSNIPVRNWISGFGLICATVAIQ